MKTWIIALTITAIFILGGVFVAASIDNPKETTDSTQPSCSPGSGCPYGGCTAGNNCGLDTCGATTGSSCGCGK
jgi:hypothetical protein